jgi:hypothetical protein
MATTLILPPSEITGRAASVLAANAAGNTPRIHSLNKAAFYLAREAVEVVPNFDGFLIASATRAGVIHRVSSVNGCSCEAGRAGKACWHAATIEILEEASRYTIPTLPRPETAPLGKPVAERIADARATAYRKALAEMNELFPN